MSTENLIVLITGANRGLGFEICRQMGLAGHTVILSSRDKKKGKHSVKVLLENKISAHFLEIDVNVPMTIAKAASKINSQYGRLDILINNAGILPDNPIQGNYQEVSIFDINPSMLRLAMKTNAFSVIEVCKQMLPLLKKSKSARIVNVSSLSGQLASMDSGIPAYRLSKVALNAVTRIIANELKPYRILCNAVSPGWVKTEMGGPNATVSIKQGAREIIKAAMLPAGGPTGLFFRKGKPIPW